MDTDTTTAAAIAKKTAADWLAAASKAQGEKDLRGAVAFRINAARRTFDLREKRAALVAALGTLDAAILAEGKAAAKRTAKGESAPSEKKAAPARKARTPRAPKASVETTPVTSEF